MVSLEALNKLITPRAQLNETLHTVINSQHKGTKLNNVLIIGDSGAGKSYALNTIKRISRLPTTELNVKLMNLKRAKQEVEELVRSLYVNSRFSKDETEKGIILIDNLEVLANSKAQLELIKLIRGANYKLTNFEDSNLVTTINTKRILFICTIGTEKLESSNKEDLKIGYELPNSTEGYIKNILPENENLVVSYKTKVTEIGVVSELVNLFESVTVLKNDTKTISKLIPNLTAEVLSEYMKAHEFNTRVVINNEVLAHITTAANAIKLGVWGLRIILHNMLQTVITRIARTKSLNTVMVGYNFVRKAYTTSCVLYHK